MKPSTAHELTAIRLRKRALLSAIERHRSDRWLLRLWSRFIKTRDAFRCLCCDSVDRIQAHHIMRRSFFPPSALDLGNGITLCPECHQRVHAEFNRKPDLSLPIGAEQGDDQDEWSFLFGLLYDDAVERGLPQNEFYDLSEPMMRLSLACQGYRELYESVIRGEMSRIRFAHEIWRPMPQGFYTRVASALGLELLGASSSRSLE